jgi:hypothetical protein
MKINPLGTALSICLVMALTFGAQAGAQDANAQGDQKKEAFLERFKAANTTGDGKLTPDQAKSGMPMVYKHFDEIDTDKKGYVTVKDIAVFAAAHRKQKQAD